MTLQIPSSYSWFINEDGDYITEEEFKRKIEEFQERSKKLEKDIEDFCKRDEPESDSHSS